MEHFLYRLKLYPKGERLEEIHGLVRDGTYRKQVNT